ncbi:DUF4062 domain-containing protein [Saccharococcus caldoxylosilyticus]|uniref:DUF4062 domain-containing protein n=1 Tax=Saccharococcus caldoxylosilyticus TaxID=81408 RepID=UPI003D347E06
MQKKLQVFISSTYQDLQEERQAAVEAVLNAGHIPAGMELFKAGDQTQKETIKRWIEESDVYMLILGGRYGTIDEESGKSYTHWEYDYAGEIGKPRFAIVIKESALEEKVRQLGMWATERENFQKYQEFRDEVLSRISKFFSDTKDIKLAVYESLKEYEKREDLIGWVSAKELGNYQNLLEEKVKLIEENSKLKEKVKKLEGLLEQKDKIGDYSYSEVLQFLKTKSIKIPKELFKELFDEEVPDKVSLLKLFLVFKDYFVTGIYNNYGMSELDKFLFFTVAPHLITLGLVEEVKVPGVRYHRVRTSKNGNKFLSKYEIENQNKKDTYN